MARDDGAVQNTLELTLEQQPLERHTLERPITLYVGDVLSEHPALSEVVRTLQAAERAVHRSSADDALIELEGLGDAVIVAALDAENSKSGGLFQNARTLMENRGGVGVFIGLVERGESSHGRGGVDATSVDDRLTVPCEPEELRARIRIAHRLVAAERERLRMQRTMELFGAVDPLTGLYNRRHGRILLERETAKVVRSKQQLSVIMADIDHFEQINEAHGRDGGDRILAAFAAVLKYTLRNYDLITRWGGDRFLIACPHTDSREVRVVAERLMQNIHRTAVRPKENVSLRITASLGSCSSDLLEPQDGLDAAGMLVAEADRMMHVAKFNGRDRTMHYAFSKPPPDRL